MDGVADVINEMNILVEEGENKGVVGSAVTFQVRCCLTVLNWILVTRDAILGDETTNSSSKNGIFTSLIVSIF